MISQTLCAGAQFGNVMSGVMMYGGVVYGMVRHIMKANWLKSSGFPKLKDGIVRCCGVMSCAERNCTVLFGRVWNIMRANQLKSGGSLNSKDVGFSSVQLS